MTQSSTPGSDTERHTAEQRQSCAPRAVLFLLLLLLIGAGAFSVRMVQQTVLLPYHDCIYPNVYVLGENLGGFTVDEAARHLRQAFAGYDSGDLILSDGEEVWRVPWSEAGLQLDPETTARNAFHAGRGQGWQTLLSMWLGEHGWGTSRDVSPVFTIDADATRRALESMAHELYVAPSDAELWLDGEQVMTTQSQPGRALAIEPTAQKIVETVTHLGPDYPFSPTYQVLSPTIVDVEESRQKVEEMLDRRIHVAAHGEHEGETRTWDWTLGREDIAKWLHIEEREEPPWFAFHIDEGAIESTTGRLAAEVEAEDWGFPTQTAEEEILGAFEAGGGDVELALTPPPRIYLVQPGDQLTTIAERFGMPPGLIAELNQGIDLNQLQIGQELVIPPQDVLTPYETVPSKRIVISIAEQRLRAYEEGELLYDWPCSTGKENSPTYRGHFQVLSKEEMAYASQWDLEMPHFLGVYRAGGDAVNGIHALPILSGGQRLWAGNLGSRASFGCIILGIEEAETLFDWAELGVPAIIE